MGICIVCWMINKLRRAKTMELIEFLKDIINGFAESEIIFSNEQDFQFQMALALKGKKFELEKGDNVTITNVYLEGVSFKHNLKETYRLLKEAKKEEKKNEVKKEYTDIVLELDDDKNIAIELKYKTPYQPYLYETPNNEMLLLGQGAYDSGSYFFIKDLERLERINTKHFTRKYNFIKGYAIMLTNEKHYWKGFNSDIWNAFNICEGSVLENNLSLDLTKTNNPDKYKGFPTIKLKGKYVIKSGDWCDYPITIKNNCPIFKYLIKEVELKAKI